MTAVVAFMEISAANEKPVQLKRAPGLDKVEAQCGGCHSLDYVVMNSPFLSAAGWDAEVAKMINAFGAPIDQSDAKVIADYLKKSYGTPIASAANEKPVQLKQAAGLDKVEAHCGACHSLDYVVMNSPFLSAAGWDAEVAKMINAFGAPIDQSDAKVIADYLKKNYGNESFPALTARPAGIRPSSLEKDEGIAKPSFSTFDVTRHNYDTKRFVMTVPRISNHAPFRRTSPENREPPACSAFQSCSGYGPLLLGVGF
jgi:mono/diheme cytochrome c family protein